MMTTWPSGRGGPGSKLAVAHDLFIHHFGGRTFQGIGIDVERLLSENSRKFAEKWGTAIGNGRAVPLRPWVGQPRMGARQDQPRMNTDLHGWDARRGDTARGALTTHVHPMPCSISV